MRLALRRIGRTPQDGHMPQMCVGGPEMVKKVVVKVALDKYK